MAKRGVSGVITALNPDSKQITISVRSRRRQAVDHSRFRLCRHARRYAPDSVRFSDASRAPSPI
jgi:hypothetical protein